MCYGCRRFSGMLLLGVLLLASLVAFSGAPASAETSYHKLKKNLRKVERAGGQAFQDAGGVLVEGLCAISVGVDCDASDDEEAPATNPSCKADKGESVKTPHPSSPKPAKAVHPPKQGS